MIRKLAYRFVSSEGPSLGRRKQGFVSFIGLISMMGLCLGVSALLTVTSVMNGFEKEIKHLLTAFHGHVLLFSRSEPIGGMQTYIKEIKKEFPDVTAVSPYIFAEAMLSSKNGAVGTVLEGVHRETLDDVSQIGTKIREGSLPDASGETPSVTLGSEVARKLKVKTGDQVILTIPFAHGENKPIVSRLNVAGIIHLGMHDYDNKYALVELSRLQKILKLNGKVNAFKIRTKDPAESYRTTASLNDKYVYPLHARDWSSLNQNLFYAIRLEKVVISIILMAIVLVASFNIISTLMMLIHDKKRQVSILKAMGWTKSQTFSVFLLIGFVMSVLGAILGVGLGRALCALLEWKSIVDIPGDVYVLSRIPVEIRPFEWVIIVLVAISLAVVSTLWPSFRVSKESPVEGLRYE